MLFWFGILFLAYTSNWNLRYSRVLATKETDKNHHCHNIEWLIYWFIANSSLFTLTLWHEMPTIKKLPHIIDIFSIFVSVWVLFHFISTLLRIRKCNANKNLQNDIKMFYDCRKSDENRSRKHFTQCLRTRLCAHDTLICLFYDGESYDSNLPKTYFHRWYRKFMLLFICYVIERIKAINSRLLVHFLLVNLKTKNQ